MKGIRAFMVSMVLLTIAFHSAAAFGAENFTPEQIKDQLTGKTKQQVKDMVGPPTTVSPADADETGQWNYSLGAGYQGKSPVILKGGRIIFDPVSEKAVAGLEIGFKGGVVSRVRLIF